MLAIQGSGSVQVAESRLWSVPVFRALFSQLGLDDQAVFDMMGANLRIKNGVLYDVYYWCETCHIRSPFGGDCWCCFQPFEFKEVLIQKL